MRRRKSKADKKDKKKARAKKGEPSAAGAADGGAAGAGALFSNPLRGAVVVLDERLAELDSAQDEATEQLLKMAFDACDKDDGESDGCIGAKTAALMVHCVLPGVSVPGVLKFVEDLHAADFSEEAWAAGAGVFTVDEAAVPAADAAGDFAGDEGDEGGKDGYAGEYRVLQAAATRETSDFASELMGQLEQGEVLHVRSGVILPSGKVRLQSSDKGWFSLVSNAGDVLVERTDGQDDVGGDIQALDDEREAPDAHDIPINFDQLSRLVKMATSPEVLHEMEQPWSEMSDPVRKCWQTLGWSEASWNDEAPHPESESLNWKELTKAQVKAATRLGYDQRSWAGIKETDDEPWSEMSDAARKSWQVLGWTEASWNDEAPHPESESQDWKELTKAQVKAATQLGYDKRSWAGMQETDEQPWSEMSDEVRQCWQTLGWTEAAWNDEAPHPASESQDWKELTKSQVKAATQLGYNMVTWTGSEDAQLRGIREILMVANVFSSIDDNHSGRIDLLELAGFSEKLRIGLTVPQLKTVWEALCVDSDSSAAKDTLRLTFDQFFEGLLYLRKLVAADESAMGGVYKTFRRGLLQSGSGPAEQVDVLLASLMQQRLDAKRTEKAIDERSAAEAAAKAAAAKQKEELKARKAQMRADAAAEKARKEEEAEEAQRQHEEKWMQSMEDEHEALGEEHSAWVEENRHKLVEDPESCVRRGRSGGDLQTMTRGLEMLRGVFGGCDVLRVHRLPKRVCAVLLAELGAASSVSAALQQIELCVHQTSDPVGTGIHRGHSLDFRELFHVFCNQSDADQMRLARLDEDTVLGLQAVGSTFSAMDTDRSGQVDRQEFQSLCAAMGAFPGKQARSQEGEMWTKLAGRSAGLPYPVFLESVMAARSSTELGAAFFEAVVWPLRSDRADELAAAWHELEAQEREQKARAPGAWHHLDSTSEEEEGEADDTAKPHGHIHGIAVTLLSRDEYIEAASNPMSVGQTLDQLQNAFESCDYTETGRLSGEIVTFVLSLVEPDWSERVLIERIQSNNLGDVEDEQPWSEMSDDVRQCWQTLGWAEASWNDEAPHPASESQDWKDLTKGQMKAATQLGYDQRSWGGKALSQRKLTFDEMIHVLVSPRAGELEVDKRLGQSAGRLEAAASVTAAAEMFSAMDTDGSGSVDANEFQVLVMACTNKLKPADVRQLWASFPKDRTGQVSLLGLMTGLKAMDLIGVAGPPTTPAGLAFRQTVVDSFKPKLPSDKKAAAQPKPKGRRRKRVSKQIAESNLDIGTLCEDAFVAVSATSRYGVVTRTSRVGVRRLLYVVHAMSDEHTAGEMRQLVEELPNNGGFVDALDLKQYLSMMMQLNLNPQQAQAGRDRIVSVANLFASLGGGSVDGTLSLDRLAAAVHFHTGKRAEKWARDELWRAVDRQGKDHLLKNLLSVSDIRLLSC